MITNTIDAKLLGLFDVWRRALADALRAPESDNANAYECLAGLERKIFDTPAHGLIGVQIKFSLWRLYVDTPDENDYREAAALSAYADLARMTGRDFDAEIRAFQSEILNARDAA
jgi:hypothetical protein